MKITILGSGTAFPDLKRNSAGVLIEHEGERSLVDLGYGNVHQLLRLGLTYHDIDRIFFTHHHPDHMCDLVYFLFAANYMEDPRTRPLPIIAGPGFRSYFERLLESFNNWLTPKAYSIEVIEVDRETRTFGPLTVTPGKVNHIPMSRAYRFKGKDGKTAVVSGDTDFSPELIELSRGVDLLILECSANDENKIDKHLTPRLCGQMAHQAECKTLCLTHFYPLCPPEDAKRICQQAYSGEILLAEDLTSIQL